MAQYQGGKTFTLKRYGLGVELTRWYNAIRPGRVFDLTCGSGAVIEHFAHVLGDRPGPALIASDAQPAAVGLLAGLRRGWEPPMPEAHTRVPAGHIRGTLRGKAREAMELIVAWMVAKRMRVDQNEHYYSGKAWRERGERWGDGCVLVVTHDGGDLYDTLAANYGHKLLPVLARSNAPLGTTENDPPTYSKENLLAHFHDVFDDRFGDPVVLTGQGDLRGRFVECPYVVYTLTRPATPVGHKPKRIHLEADAVLNSAIDQLDRAGFEDAAAYLRSRS